MNKQIVENLRGFEIKLRIKPGVFSPCHVDDGTKLLIDNLEIEDGTLIADLGAGIGVIGLVCAKLDPSGRVHLLEDHVRSFELLKENINLNNCRNVENYLSDLFSAVGNRTYHQIFSNPPQHLGNEFLEEMIVECRTHLKPGGEVWWVVQKHIKPVAERLFQKYCKNCTIVAHGKEHVVLKAKKN